MRSMRFSASAGCAPPIVAASAVGLLVALVQAATQLQEQTLQYTLKFFAIVATIFLTASLLAGSLYQYGNTIFTQFPAMVRQLLRAPRRAGCMACLDG